MPRRGKRWILVKHFDGFPKEGDLRLEEFDLPELKECEVLLEAEYLSVDPYMRPFSAVWMKEGDMMIGQQIAKVVESRNPDYPVGTWTQPRETGGWTTHSINDCSEEIFRLHPLPEGVPRSYALGTLGWPGISAYFGFLDICNPKPGETVMVSAAAGAVGNVVGQIAKIKGCRVIGSAGSDKKVAYVKELGFDDAFNYKTTTDWDAKLKELAPQGIDCYFDNVGGEFANVVAMNMRDFGRISCCGSISTYNLSDPTKVTPVWSKVLFSQLKVEGFLATRFLQDKERFQKGRRELCQWVAEGKIKVREHVTEGFENTFKAFSELFVGANTGKAVVKV